MKFSNPKIQEKFDRSIIIRLVQQYYIQYFHLVPLQRSSDDAN